MADLIICEQCDTGFEYEPSEYSATCQHCGHRHHPRTGCC